jgi:FkbM family methyltransferase
MNTKNLLYRFCRSYVNRVHGENNGDMKTNGELRWLKEVAPLCHTIFDVGANIGEWTELCLDINPLAKIHCFEPSQTTYKELEKRFLEQNSQKVFLNHFGLSSDSGETSLHLFHECAGSNSLYQRKGLSIQQEKTELVKLKTLDQYCKENNLIVDHIDLLKIDVEGHELDVLKGSKDMLEANKVDRIQFEYGGCFIDAKILLKDIFELLAYYNYRFYKIYPLRLEPIKSYDQKLENFQYQNWVAISSKIDR